MIPNLPEVARSAAANQSLSKQESDVVLWLLQCYESAASQDFIPIPQELYAVEMEFPVGWKTYTLQKIGIVSPLKEPMRVIENTIQAVTGEQNKTRVVIYRRDPA